MHEQYVIMIRKFDWSILEQKKWEISYPDIKGGLII